MTRARRHDRLTDVIAQAAQRAVRRYFAPLVWLISAMRRGITRLQRRDDEHS